MKTWLSQSVAQLGRGIGRGDIDPVALTETYLEACASHPLAPRIYARLTTDRARAEAQAASDRARAGQRLGPIDGVPISWKDLFDTAGVATEAGSRLLAGRLPARDARVLQNATSVGLVCLGKTHMSELAFSGLGLNPMTETPPCVNDLDAVPGGSSSGAAASVAFGLAAAGIGSDTGGSVRIPSAWNDLVGLKTTSGRVSNDGVVPLASRFDTVGPLCRSVEDAALLFSALTGTPDIDLRGATLAGVRFGVLETVAVDDIRDEPLKGFERGVAALQDAGAEVSRFEASEVAAAMPLSAILYTSEAYGIWKDVIEASPESMYAEILQRFRGGDVHGAADYVAAWRTLEACRSAWHDRTRGFDAILVPTAPILPPDHARLLKDHDYYVAENLLALRNTRIGNLLGLSALSLPTGVPSTGITLMGRGFDEERLLRLGAAAELALSRA